MSQLKKGIFINILSIFCTTIIGLLLTPYIISKIGDSQYGLYILVGSIISYFSLMNFGIGNALIRFVSKHRINNESKLIQLTISTSFWIYLVLTGLLLLIGVLFFFNINSLFRDSLDIHEISTLKVMFILLLLNLFISLPGKIFEYICLAYERFSYTQYLVLFKYLFRSTLIIIILILGYGVIQLVLVDVSVNILGIIVTFFFVKKNLRINFSINKFSKSLSKELITYSIWVFLFGIVYKFQWNAGQIILGMNNNANSIAIFGVGLMLAGFYGAFAGSINNLLVPKATNLVYSKVSKNNLTNEIVKVSRLILFILCLILSGFYLFGKEFINLWLGEKYMESWIIAILMMSAMTITYSQGLGNSILEAKKKNKFKSILSILSISSAIILSYFLTKKFNFLGVLIPLVSAICLNNVIMNFYYRKIFDFNIILFFKQSLIPVLLLSVVLVFFTKLLKIALEINSWLTLLIGILVYTLIFTFSLYYFIMNEYEKNLIRMGLGKVYSIEKSLINSSPK